MGTAPKTVSHAWLERDELILDITADQFDEIDHPIPITAIAPGTTSSPAPTSASSHASRWTSAELLLYRAYLISVNHIKD